MKQKSFAASEFVKKPKQTRKERFLQEMESVVPWARLLAVIEPHYPKAGNGRRPYEYKHYIRQRPASLGAVSVLVMEDVSCT